MEEDRNGSRSVQRIFEIGTRVTLRLLYPEVYLAQHTAVPVTSPMVRFTMRAVASPSTNSQDLSRL